MKYIYNNPRTRELLSYTNGNERHDTCITRFFFHNRGTVLQKSQSGLLRAILLQILQSFPELIPTVFPARWASIEAGSSQGDILSWSTDELEIAFLRLVKQDVKVVKICLFVDGLDEYSGIIENLITILQTIENAALTNKTQIKACISSRPAPVLEENFFGIPTVRLQDLTFTDITLYISDVLGTSNSWKSLSKMNVYQAEDFIQDIAKKASGVFLWVVLVVRSLRNGLMNGNTIGELEARLAELEPDLELLYRRMVDSIQPRYRAQARRLFEIIQGAEVPLTLWELALTEESLESTLRRPFTFTISYTEQAFACQNMLKRIQSRCLGLLEVQSSMSLEDSWSSDSTVQFLHQTVKEFLANPENLQILESGCDSQSEVYLSLSSMKLSVLKQYTPSSDYAYGEKYWTMWEQLRAQCQVYLAKVTRKPEVHDTVVRIATQLDTSVVFMM